MAIETAVIVCEPGLWVDEQLLGLRVGERVLLALGNVGVTKICFIGEGRKPECDRVSFTEINANQIEVGAPYFLLPSDAVLTPAWLRGASKMTAIPVKTGGVDAVDEHAPFEDESVLRANSPRQLRHARKELLRSLRKPIDGMVSRFINRRISLAITPILLRTGLSPNTFTILFLMIGLLAAYFATGVGTPWMLVAAGVWVQAQSILDGCDGEMARLTYRFSKSGQWLDTIGDDITNYAFCFGLAFGLYRFSGEAHFLNAGFVVLGIQVAASAVLYQRLISMGTGDLLAIPDAVADFQGRGVVAFLMRGLRQLFKRDSFVLILAIITALQRPLVAFLLFAVGSVIMFGGVVLNELELRRAPSEPNATS